MKHMTTHLRWCARALLLVALGGLTCTSTNAGVTILGAQYQPDQYFPEFNCYWNASNYPDNCKTPIRGATVHVYIKNTGTSSVAINDATLAGYNLVTVIKKSTASWNPDEQNSIYFYWDNPPADILAAGEPVWYRFDPPTIPAGGVGQVAVRLRNPPTTPAVSLGVVTSAGTVTTNLAVDASAPQLASIGYSDDLKKVYLHWRRSGGAAPTSVWLDGTNVTATTTTVGDSSVNFGASVISLANPLPFFSYHVYQGFFADGKAASASQRVWTNKFIYATYSSFAFGGSYDCTAWIVEATDHGFNNVQMNLGDVGSCLGTGTGQSLMRQYGYGYTILDKSKLNNIDPDMWFLNDEPDCEEDNQSNIHCGTGYRIPCGGGHSAGTLVIKTLGYAAEVRAARPNVPITVNLDGALEPESFFTWGPAMDILQTDNYYEVRLKDAYWSHPTQIPLFNKAKVSYAVARTACAGAEPNPSNHLLYSCKYKNSSTGNIWPYPTPQSKRMEAYYSLAGGSKGMGYWWLNTGWPSYGLAKTTECAALWKEMGLIGNEIKTVRPLLVRSTPVDLPLTTSVNVWARGLAVGTDSLILFIVNDNYYNDQAGCHYTAVGNATVTATLPSWLCAAPTAFEVSAGGLSDVSTVFNGSQLQVNLGTLNLTRMVVVTADPTLRSTIQARYDSQVRPRVCNFAPELCANNPPSIAQQPANQSVASGGTANFSVVVSGTSPFGYQWQKNQANLSNGGHYAGCTTGTLTISNAGSDDAASYRCVVTNAYGSVTSSVAVLTIGGSCSAPVLLNGSFELSYLNGVATNWTAYQRGTIPANTVWTIQTANPPSGGGAQYQQIANTNATAGGGGVRQNVTGCVVGGTYQISGWMRGNSIAYATCTVKVSPSASTEWGTAIDLNPPQTYTGTNWTAFSGTVVAAGTNMTLWLDGQTGGTGAFKAECFDAVTVTCLSAPSTPPGLTQQPSTRTICEGTTVSFSVGASGSDLVYQWQQNDLDLGDDGHYLDCTTPTLTITNVDSGDAANYRCRVSNSSGWTNSAEAGLTVRAATTLAQQPFDVDAAWGGTVNFIVAATGDGTLAYQWQKNQTNLNDGGHYWGCTTPVLTISGVNTNDAAAYRCVVNGGCGATVSLPASLTIGCTPISAILLNGDFEDPTNAPGLGTNWVGYQRAPIPTNTVWSIQTASPPTGGGLQYQQIANASSEGGGGVRQDVTGCTVGATYLVSGWMRGNSLANATCTVKVSPSASTDWSTAIDLNPPQTYTGTNWTAFSGTVVATGPSMTLWLDGQTGGSGLFKAECFDSVAVNCMTAPLPPLSFASVVMLPEGQVGLVVTGPPEGSVTVKSSGDLVGWTVLTNLVNTNGTVQVFDTPPPGAAQRFYRATSP